MGRYTNKKETQARDIIRDGKRRHVSYEHMEIISVRDGYGGKKQYVVIDLPSFREYVGGVNRMLDVLDSLLSMEAPARGPKAKSSDH